MTLREFSSVLAAHGCRPTGTGSQLSARCPAHEDHTASLSVGESSDGKLLVHCHAGCRTDEVCAALGLKLADLFLKQTGNGAGRIVAEYDYRDASGELLFQSVRYVPKDFKQRRPDGKGDWAWNMQGIERVLYRLPELLRDVKRGLPVFVVEGEKDVAALVKLGFTATCNVGGAGKWLDTYTTTLRGADVIIIADKDGPGRAHAALVAGELQGIAKRVRVLELPDVGGKPVKDAHDYFGSGASAGDLVALVDAAEDWTPARSNSAGSEYLPGPDETPAPVPPKGRLLSELACPRHGADDLNELLRDRYLCRGGGLLLVGPTGIGKSSLALFFAILWALGRAAFGIPPARPLKSLFIQAENDDGDLAEMRDGIIAGLKLSPEDAATACGSIVIINEDSRTGLDFISGVVRPGLSEHRPHLLWIDPALAFLGGEASSQKEVGAFLRNGINPLLHEFECGGIIIHHTNKPPTGTQRPTWAAGDFAYLGGGSAEWANWPRAVLALRSIGSHNIFELRAAKRGGRLRWKSKDGTTAFSKLIGYALDPNVICWREVEDSELEPTGRPKAHDPEEVFGLLPPGGLKPGEWLKQADEVCGVSKTTFHRFRKEFVKSGRIILSQITGNWQPVNSKVP